MFKCEHTYYLRSDGTITTEKEPGASRVLFRAGAEIPRETARKYGLIETEGAAAREDAPLQEAPVPGDLYGKTSVKHRAPTGRTAPRPVAADTTPKAATKAESKPALTEAK